VLPTRIKSEALVGKVTVKSVDCSAHSREYNVLVSKLMMPES